MSNSKDERGVTTPSEKLQQLMITFQNAQKEISTLQLLISQAEATIEMEEHHIAELRRVIVKLEEERHILRKEQDGLLELEKSLLQELSTEKQKQQSLYQDIIKAEDEAELLKKTVLKANDDYVIMLMNKSKEYIALRESLKFDFQADETLLFVDKVIKFDEMPRNKSAPNRRENHNLNLISSNTTNSLSNEIINIDLDDINNHNTSNLQIEEVIEGVWRIHPNDLEYELPNSNSSYILINTNYEIDESFICIGAIVIEINCPSNNNMKLFVYNNNNNLMIENQNIKLTCFYGLRLVSLLSQQITIKVANLIRHSQNFPVLLFYLPRHQISQGRFISSHSLNLLIQFGYHEWLNKSDFKFNDQIKYEVFDSNLFLDILSSNSNEKTKTITEDNLNILESELQSMGLTTNLRRYQLQGIYWMYNHLTRLTHYNNISLGVVSIPIPNIYLDKGIITSNLNYNAISLVYDLQSSHLYYSSQQVINLSNKICVLADAMGLGKSIEILCLIFKLRYDKNLSDIEVSNLNSIYNIDLNYNVNKHDEIYSCACKRSYSGKFNWIQCIQCSRWSHSHCEGIIQSKHFICYTCKCIYYNKYPIKSNATIIVLPDTLIQQWQYELQKHFRLVSKIKIFIYETIDSQTLTRRGLTYADVSPDVLSSYDIIFIGFNTLKREFNEASATDMNEINSLNSRKSSIQTRRSKHQTYVYNPPPILCLEYLLVVVDETQKLEGVSTNRILAMASRLCSIYRVCLSGTPIGNDKLVDLHSLCQFLHLEPFNKFNIYKSIFIQPTININTMIRFQWLCELFNTFSIRRNKNDVLDQLNLNQKKYITKYLYFSQFELALYKEQKDIALSKLHTLTSHNNHNHDELAKNQLDLLRKGCCHPQVFDKSLYSYSIRQKRNDPNSQSGPRPFNEIMIIKIEQIRNVCEEKLRQILLQLYTMTGCEMIRGDIQANSESKLLCYSNVLLIYQYAYYLINRARTETELITLVRIADTDKSNYIGNHTTTSDNINLIWSINSTKIKEINDNSQLIQKEVKWFSSIIEAYRSSIVINEEMIEIPNKQAKLVFHNNHKLKKLVDIRLDISNFVNLMIDDEILVIAFPSEANVYCYSSSNIYTLCNTYKLSTPSLLADSNTIIVQTAISDNINNEYRSRSWKISYPCIYTNHYIVIHNIKGSNNQHIYEYMIWDDNIENMNYLIKKPYKLILSTTLSFEESLYDVDLYQHLHLNTNVLHAISTMLSLDTQDVRYHYIYSALRLGEMNKVISLNAFDVFRDDIFNESQEFIVNNEIISYINQRTEDIKKHSEEIENKFLIATKARHRSAQLNLTNTLNESDKFQQYIIELSPGGCRDWWSNYLTSMNENDVESTLQSIRQSIIDGQYSEKYQGFKSLTGLVYILSSDFNECMTKRQDVILKMNKLSSEPSLDEIIEGSNCRRCRVYLNKSGRVCKHCLLDDQITSYGLLLCTTTQIKIHNRFNDLTEDIDDNNDRIIRKSNNVNDSNIANYKEIDSFFISTMKQIKMNSHRLFHDDISETVNMEISYYKNLRLEFSSIRNYWNRHMELLKAYDELEQCKLRLEFDFTMSDESLLQDFYQSYHLSVSLADELQSAVQSLNFYKSQEIQARLASKRRASNQISDNASESCIICQDDLTSGKVVVLPCAHLFHGSCISKWLKVHKKCVICKRPARLDSMSTVANYGISQANQISPSKSTDRSTRDSLYINDDVTDVITHEVKGSWGTKIDTLIADVLLFIRSEDLMGEKAIIFSQWVEMVEIVSQALTYNNISHSCCTNYNKDFKLGGPLDSFKINPDIRILIMPLYLGAEGLDLIVASHVFLLEPLINSNLEAQAINRIDRIGQKKQPHIIKYVIKNTVEEKIINSVRVSTEETTITAQSPKKPRHSRAKEDQINLSLQEIFEIVGDEEASSSKSSML